MRTAQADAYRHCEDVTRMRAQNFFYGIRLLPPDKRRAMCAVYAFARRVDDIGDGSLPADRKLSELDGARTSLREVGHDSADPVIVALGDAAHRFSLPHDAFVDLIDGVEMDVRGTRYDSFDELVTYCRRVAGSVGRLCVSIFGASDMDAARPLADDLGVAMQLTNILRDVREDLALGRVYLPAEDLGRFGCNGDLASAPGDTVAALIRFEAARDREWFARGLELLPMLDARSASCLSAMTGIYRRILERIERHPEEVMRTRISLPMWEKAWVTVRGVTWAGARATAQTRGQAA